MEINGVEKPQMKKGYLGPQPRFKTYGLATLSHNEPDIQLDDNELDIKLQQTEPVKITANLINAVTEKDFRECIFNQISDDVLTLTVSIPEPGFYKFQIYALPASEDSKTLYGVFNYMICCKAASKPCRIFPKQYASWKQGCYLYEPLSIGCDDKSTVNFKVQVPGALDVALTIEGQWTHLSQTSPSIWEGCLNLAEFKGKNSKLALNANFGGDSTKFSTLLDYQL